MVDVGEARVFFKVLLGDFNVNLRLPDKFVRSFIGKEKWAKLNLSSSILGKQWTVEIREDSCGFHLSGNRWRDFVQDHDLRFGYFLVFKYLRDMDFLVEPFDHSCCIKLYPPVQEDNTTTDHHVQHSKFSEGKKNSSQETTKYKLKKKKKKNGEKNLKVQKKPQFKICMQPSYIDKRFMNLPRIFRDANNLSTINEAILTNTNGRWPVKICHTPQKGKIHSVFSAGWAAFIRENNLKLGDVCIFDLLSKDGNRVNFFATKEGSKEVEFSRNERNYNVSGRNINLKMRNDGETATDKLKMMKKKSVEKILKVKKKPQFKIGMTRTHIYKRLMNFPRSFRDANNLSTINKVILTNTNGRWPARFCHTPHKGNINSVFSAGWSAFVRENNLKLGDVCIFCLLSKDENGANFFATKEVDFSREEDNSNVSGTNISRKVGNSTIESQGSNLPGFEVTIRKTHFFSKGVHIPVGFEGFDYLYDKSKVKLINSLTGRSWEVMIFQKRQGSHTYPRFAKGWLEFCRDNKLASGDVCSFKLISKKSRKPEMAVNILKTNSSKKIDRT